MDDIVDRLQNAVAAERERCIKAIWSWPGLTDDEKRIVELVIRKGE